MIRDANTANSQRNPQLGATFMVVATIFFSFQDGVTKTLLHEYSIWQLVIVRFTVLACLITVLSLFRGRAPQAIFRSKQPVLQILRGTILVMEVAFVGQSYKYLGLAETMTIFHIFPFIGLVLAVVFLKEKLGLPTIAAMVVCMIGLYIATASAVQPNLIGVACALAAAVCYAGYIVLTRFVSANDDVFTSVFYISILGIVIPLFFFSGSIHGVNPKDYWQFFVLCGFNIVAQCSVVVALSLARASSLQPFNYLQIIWASLLGYFVFSETPSAQVIVGGALIAGAGLFQMVTLKCDSRKAR